MPAETDPDRDAERLDCLLGSRPHIRVSRLSEDGEPHPSPGESSASTAEGARD